MESSWRITQARIPPELYERIRTRAHEERKSINQTMNELMEWALKKIEGE